MTETQPTISKGYRKYPKDYNPIREYWHAIEENEITVSKKVRKTVKHLVEMMDDKKSIWLYDPDKANHVIEFCENFCRHSKGKMGGKPVILMLWEKAFLAAVFGFVDINGIRKYRKAVLIVGKKNGKSLIASCVALYLQVADGEPGPEIYAVATKKDQAKIIWLESKRMVRKSKVLAKRIKTLVSELQSDFNDGVYKPLASDSDTLDGLNVHGALMDEIHQWKNGRALYDIIADGVSAREQPLILITSTAGTIREDLYDDEYEEAERIVNGYFDPDGYKDDSELYFIYEIDDRKEWTDQSCWIKANPSLGVTKSKEYLKNKVEKAKENPKLVKNLICKEFNIRETSSEAWLPFDELNNTARYDIAELKPRYGIGGLDLSNTTDLTCATVIFRVRNDETLYVKQMFWLPGDLLEKRVKEDKVPYDKWLDRGLIRISEGNKVNYKDVVEWFEEVQKNDDIFMFKGGYDSWNSQYVVDELKQRFGQACFEPVIQGKKSMSGPLKILASDLAAKNVNYDNNPITKWCLANAAVDIDRNDNISLIKTSKSRMRIDGAASLADAFVVYQKYYQDYIEMI